MTMMLSEMDSLLGSGEDAEVGGGTPSPNGGR
jgi:hypothetical protein